jgi:hypothetical protein
MTWINRLGSVGGTDGKERGVLQDLAVLTPSLVVCAAFLTGVVIMLRREMTPRRRTREGDGSSAGTTAGREISESEDDTATATSDREQAADPQAGSRSLD